LQGHLEHDKDIAGTERDEEDGHQPFGQDFRDFGRSDGDDGAGGAAPGGQDDRDGVQDARAGVRRHD